MTEEQKKFDRFVELNVIEQVYDLANTSIIQNAWNSEQPLHAHGWVYNIDDGFIRDLNVTLMDNKTLDQVYQIGEIG